MYMIYLSDVWKLRKRGVRKHRSSYGRVWRSSLLLPLRAVTILARVLLKAGVIAITIQTPVALLRRRCTTTKMVTSYLKSGEACLPVSCTIRHRLRHHAPYTIPFSVPCTIYRTMKMSYYHTTTFFELKTKNCSDPAHQCKSKANPKPTCPTEQCKPRLQGQGTPARRGESRLSTSASS